MFKVRTLVDILRHAGFGPITCAFALVFMVCSTAVWLADAQTLTLGDGMWFSFEVVSTIGFGDVSAQTPVARVATVVLSVFSIFYVALITGVVVSYCTTLVKARQKGTLAHFSENLQRLDQMSPEELADFSCRVKEWMKKQG